MNENVLRGIQLLDEKIPDWRSKVNWDKLNMTYTCGCILGHLFGFYSDGLVELNLIDKDEDWYKSGDGIYYGFDTSGGSNNYEALTQLWKELGEQS